jgi:hypothetical protein
MKRPGIRVEPLSEVSWGRIERRLAQRLDATTLPSQPERRVTSRRPWLWIGAAIAVAGAGCVLAIFLRAHGGRAQLARATTRWVSGASNAHVNLEDAALDMAPQSALALSGSDEQGFLLVLDRGQVTCDVAPRRGRPPFVVQAGDVQVRVLGTRFTIRRVRNDARVDVDHGTVEIIAKGRVVTLEDGQHFASSPAAEPEAPPTPAAAPAPPSPPEAKALRRDRLAHAEPVKTATAPPVPQPTPSPPAAPASAASPPPVSEASLQARYETAAQLEARAPEEALAIYSTLASGSGPWAANALYAEARLQMDRGLATEASALLRRYLERFPDGPNADDARAVLQKLR